jgi:RNA polymerase sigma-70 factor (ECF subfamily)
MNQEELIQKLRAGGQTELGMIYEEHRSEFLGWIAKEYQCSPDDCQDIYQMTILIFYDNIKQGKLEHLVSSVKTYLFGIGKNIARETLRREKRHVPIQQEKYLKHQLIDEPAETRDDANFSRAQTALEKLGQPCQRLIELFYYEKKSIAEITDTLHYKNPETAKNQKCKCMARLRKLFEQEKVTHSIVINHELP